MTPFALDHPLVRDYLWRLNAATAHLPADEQSEISEGIRSHLLTALADAHTESEIRSVLDALGQPEEIVGSPPPAPQWAPVPPLAPKSARGPMEIIAVILLLIGAAIVPIIGWVAGVVLLWVSKAWTTREKVLGTLVVPGGLAAGFFAAFIFPFVAIGGSCAATGGGVTTIEIPRRGGGGGGGGSRIVPPDPDFQVMAEGCGGFGGGEILGIALMIFLIVGPIVTAIYLLRAAGKRTAVA